MTKSFFFYILLFFPLVLSAHLLQPGRQSCSVGGGWVGSSVDIMPYTMYGIEGNARQPEAALINFKTKTDSNSWFVFFNYQYAIDCHWQVGAEIDYKNLGNFGYKAKSVALNTDNPHQTYDSDAISALFTGSYTLPCSFYFFGKAGVARVKNNFDQRLYSFRQPAINGSNLAAVADYSFIKYHPEIILGLGTTINCRTSIIFQMSRIAKSFSSLFLYPRYNNYRNTYTDTNELVIALPESLDYTMFMVGVSFSLPQIFKGKNPER